jgi:hypothetical protein
MSKKIRPVINHMLSNDPFSQWMGIGIGVGTRLLQTFDENPGRNDQWIWCLPRWNYIFIG